MSESNPSAASAIEAEVGEAALVIIAVVAAAAVGAKEMPSAVNSDLVRESMMLPRGRRSFNDLFRPCGC